MLPLLGVHRVSVWVRFGSGTRQHKRRPVPRLLCELLIFIKLSFFRAHDKMIFTQGSSFVDPRRTRPHWRTAARIGLARPLPGDQSTSPHGVGWVGQTPQQQFGVPRITLELRGRRSDGPRGWALRSVTSAGTLPKARPDDSGTEGRAPVAPSVLSCGKWHLVASCWAGSLQGLPMGCVHVEWAEGGLPPSHHHPLHPKRQLSATPTPAKRDCHR